MSTNPQNATLNVVGQAIVSTMNLGATAADINALKVAAFELHRDRAIEGKR